MKLVACVFLDALLQPEPFLGSTDDWRRRVVFRDGAVEGVRLLNRLPARTVLVAPMPGVAVREFPQLTEQRAREVCAYLVDVLASHHVLIDRFVVCPHAQPGDPERHPEFSFEPSLVRACGCIWPRLNAVTAGLGDASQFRLVAMSSSLAGAKTGVAAGGVGVLVAPRAVTEEELSEILSAPDLVAAAQLLGSNASGQI